MALPRIVRAAALRLPGVRQRYDAVKGALADFDSLRREHVRQAGAYDDEITELRQALEHAYTAVEAESARAEAASAARDGTRERTGGMPAKGATPAQVLIALTEPDPVGGKSYSARLPDHLPGGDTPEEPGRSRLQLLEDGVPLGPAHALHADIADKGDGLYSHWGDGIVFSASDGSDPRTNGRAYHALVPPARKDGATEAALMQAKALHPIHDFEARGGHTFSARLPAGLPPGDGDEDPGRSRLQVIEDGVPLGPAHAPHTEIADEGRGRYSHWGDGLFLSTSDNSNPRTNGRVYHVLLPARGSAATEASARAKALQPIHYFEAQGGHTFSARLPAGLPPGDAAEDPGRSRLQLLEDGVPLGPAHAPHWELAEEGKGRYSHWGDGLVFSTSDNSDPRTNGRDYHLFVLPQNGLQYSGDRSRLGSTAEERVTGSQALDDEVEALKLQNYILQSDLNRSVARMDTLRSESQQAGRERESAQSRADEAERRCAEMKTRSAEREAAQARADEAERRCTELKTRLAEREAEREHTATWRPEVEQSYARLLGATSLISADLRSLRQSVRAEGGDRASLDVALRQKYLDLLESALTGRLYEDPSIASWAPGYDPEVRQIGRDWPSLAQTMIGTVRMRNIRTLAEQILEDGVAGDFLEAGVWRGGACIYMRGILDAHADAGRRVFVADSFAGLPEPDPDHYPVDAGDPHHTVKELAIPLEEVKKNFMHYGLLDERVVFLKGWFKDTLPGAPVEKLALLRLDGDMYASTMQTLEALYHKVSPNGFVIIDDYILPTCRRAVDDFRAHMGITAPIHDIDGAGVYWRKTD